MTNSVYLSKVAYKQKTIKQNATMKNVFVAFLLILSSYQTAQADEHLTHYNKGLNNLSQKDYLNAISHFTLALAHKPDFAEAFYHRAMAKKDLAAKENLYTDEYCSDLISALSLGFQASLSEIKSHCTLAWHTYESLHTNARDVYAIDLSGQDLAAHDLTAQINKPFIVGLNLRGTDYAYIDLAEFKQLVILDISANGFLTLGEVFSKHEHLEELVAENNLLLKICPEIYGLSNLKKLDLSRNQIEKLDEQLTNWKNLEVLDLSFNRIRHVPAQISELTNLKTLNLAGNPISLVEIKKIKRLLPYTEVIY